MLKDNSAIAVSSIIFPIFFFGKDFKNRIFNRSVFAGKSRGQILTARLLTFLILSLLLSMAELCVAMICYIPNVFVLGTGHVLRHMFIRLIIDIGVLSMPVILQFAFRDVLKSTGIYVLLFCLYARYYATHWDSEIPVYLLGTTNNLHPWMENLSFGNFLPIVFTSTVTLIISVSIAYLFFRRSELK
jgi:hypothetical protein